MQVLILLLELCFAAVVTSDSPPLENVRQGPHGIVYWDGERMDDYILQTSKVCFGAKGRSYGSFNATATGIIESVKFEHLSGTVSCNRHSSGVSFFGCKLDTLDTILTDWNDAILFPEVSTISGHGSYKVKGFTANSKELVLENKVTNPYIEKGQELRIWYGEDLTQKYDGDNSGRSCVRVWAKIRPVEYKLQRKNVCFNAKGNNAGEFRIKESGILTNIKLVWKSGHVECHAFGGSHWGCYSKLGVVVTSSDDKVIFPKPNVNGRVVYYKRPRYNVNSETLLLDNPLYHPIVKEGQRFRLWYGEDLFNHWEFDNHGRTCADVYAAVTPHEFVLQEENVCFGSRGSSYATFKTTFGGELESIKLKYKSGYVTCKETKSAWHSHWGCGGKGLTTLITTTHDKVIFPAHYKKGTGEFTLPGYTSQSNEIILNNPNKVTKVDEGQELRIWFGEDLFNHWEGDNGNSKTCVDVYASYGKKDLRCYGQDNGCCTAETPCDEGEGDCDEDSECADGLTCGNSNCPWGDKDDCCMAPPRDFVPLPCTILPYTP